MKLLMVMIVGFVLVGCGPARNEYFRTRWVSNTDQLSFDFSEVEHKTRTPFSYVGEDGTICGAGGDLHITVDFSKPSWAKEQGYNRTVILEWDSTPPSGCRALNGTLDTESSFLMKPNSHRYINICTYEEEFVIDNCKLLERL